MAEWYSDPEVSHSGGTFDFPVNSGESEITYTIYCISDNNCMSTATHTVYPIIPPNPCKKYGFSTFSSITISNNEQYVSGTTSFLSAGTLVVLSKPEWTQVVSYHSENLIVYRILCEENISDVNRSGYILLQSEDDSCTFETGSIIQEPNNNTKLATYFPMDFSENSCLQNLSPDGMVNVDIELNINGVSITTGFTLNSSSDYEKIDLGSGFTYSTNVIIESMTINGKLKFERDGTGTCEDIGKVEVTNGKKYGSNLYSFDKAILCEDCGDTEATNHLIFEAKWDNDENTIYLTWNTYQYIG